MKSDKAYDFNEYELYPLNLRDSTVEEDDLQYFHSELEKISSSLFVENHNDCHVGVFEAIFASSECHIRKSKESVMISHKDEFNQKKLLSTEISSLNEMQDILRVNEIAPTSTQSNEITIERFATE